MSSAHSPTWGKSSLTSIPLWPYFLKVKGERISAPVFRSVATMPPGSGWPWILVQRRLRVEAIHLRQSAIHEQENDSLRFRLEIEFAGRSVIG